MNDDAEFSFFRSEEMVLLRMFIQSDAAYRAVHDLAEAGYVQFRNLNADTQANKLKFKDQVKRTDEMQRKLRFFLSQIQKDKKIELGPVDGAPEDIDSLEVQFEEYERDLLGMNTHFESMNRHFNESVEYKHVLSKANVIIAQAGQSSGRASLSGIGELEPDTLDSPLLQSEGFTKTMRLGFITGVIMSDKKNTFERMCFRACRGNIFIKYTPIDTDKIVDPVSGEVVEKHVFIVFFSGERSHQKIQRIIDSFQARAYPFPESEPAHAALTEEIAGKLRDLKQVIAQTEEHRRVMLQRIADRLRSWEIRIKKEKAVFTTLNMCQYNYSSQCLVAEVWCPKNTVDDVNILLRRTNESIGAQIDTLISPIPNPKFDPPTYFKTNRFTQAFQGIVEAYGVAKYREFNPTPFAIVTFPFLFAVMFGDVGHGLLMTIFAIWMVVNEKALAAQRNEMVVMIFNGRYLLLLMAIFSVYTGLLYNEVFSVPMNLFGTKWDEGQTDLRLKLEEQQKAGTYAFGLDPAWHGTSNELQFVNSMKMKMSIVLGVTQMMVGIFLSALNAVHFKKPLNFICEFIPQVLFLGCTFGYLAIMIFLKWSIDWTARQKPPYTDCVVDPATGNPSKCYAPSLVSMLISMFLKFSMEPEEQMFTGQVTVQIVFVLIAFVSVFVMLLPKPFLLNSWNEAEKAQHKEMRDRGVPEEQIPPPTQWDDHGDHGEFQFSDVFVRQIIHTIEFVLGCVSNTASYLRLWALSLAHSQLSVVFWDKVMVNAFNISSNFSFIGIFIAFTVWAVITMLVLMIMESLSAFLHALRLHWVEFMNKFYGADGVKFEPLSYKAMQAELDDAMANE